MSDEDYSALKALVFIALVWVATLCVGLTTSNSFLLFVCFMAFLVMTAGTSLAVIWFLFGYLFDKLTRRKK